MKRPELPRHVYHLAEEVNWPSIQLRGLLSARLLLAGADTARSEGNQSKLSPATLHRPASLILADGTLIRDQAPMPPAALARCLVGGITPAEWYGLLNSQVFFWFDPARVERQRQACAPRPQVVLTIDTHRLLARHRERASVTPFNTGFARRRPAQRGRNTFVPYQTWLASTWATESAGQSNRCRPANHVPAELTILDAVPDVIDFVVAVRPLPTGIEFRS